MNILKRKSILIALHLLFLLIIGLVFFKFSEEITRFKSKIYSLKETAQLDSNIDFSNYPAFIHTGEEWWQNTRLVYHAGGGINGLDYTNSKEALENTLSNQKYFIEIDFSYTSDHELVCMHEWEEQWNSETIPSLQEFSCQKIYGIYSTMTASDAIQYMENYPELHIIIDTKENDLIEVVKDLVDLSSYNPNITDRFIIQLYDIGIKEQIMSVYPFKDDNFLFTAYKFGYNFPNKIMKLCYDENVSVITIPYGKWDAATKDLFVSKNIIIFEHTVNRPDYAQFSLEEGTYGFYTDFMSSEALDIRADAK